MVELLCMRCIDKLRLLSRNDTGNLRLNLVEFIVVKAYNLESVWVILSEGLEYIFEAFQLIEFEVDFL